MDLETFMKESGYHNRAADPVYGKDGVEYWWKKLSGTTHQFVVRMWPALRVEIHQQSMPSFEVEMTYEVRNNVWANTKFYGLTYTQLCANLARLEDCLMLSRLSMGAKPDSYTFDGG